MRHVFCAPGSARSQLSAPAIGSSSREQALCCDGDQAGPAVESGCAAPRRGLWLSPVHGGTRQPRRLPPTSSPMTTSLQTPRARELGAPPPSRAFCQRQLGHAQPLLGTRRSCRPLPAHLAKLAGRWPGPRCGGRPPVAPCPGA